MVYCKSIHQSSIKLEAAIAKGIPFDVVDFQQKHLLQLKLI